MSTISIDVLLEGLLNPSNSIRKQAEAVYAAGIETPAGTASTLGQLLTILSTSTSPDRQRVLSAVLTRRLLQREERWKALPPDAQSMLKTGLLAAFAAERSRFLQQKMAHTIAQVASTSGGPGCSAWPELLAAVFTMAQAPAAATRESALFVFALLAEYAGSELLLPHAAQLHPVMAAMLKDADNAVRVMALQGTTALIACLDEAVVGPAARAAFQALVPDMLEVLQRALGADELVAREALQALISLLQQDALFLRPHFEAACACMLVVSRAEAFDGSTRVLALEFMVSLAEVAAASLRKMVPLVQAIVDLSLQFLALVDEDPKWAAGEDSENSLIGDESEGAYEEFVVAGSAALDRISLGVGGKFFWPLLSAAIAPLLASADWKARRAGVLAVALTAEGCKKFLVPLVRDVVAGVVPFTRDAHPRVRHAAVRCLGELIGDFSNPSTAEAPDAFIPVDLGAPVSTRTTSIGGTAARGKGRDAAKSIQDAASDLVVPALIEAMAGPANAAVPRVRAIAAQATVNFCLPEWCETADLRGLQRPLLEALFGVLQGVPLRSAREGALTAVGCVAQVIEAEFVEYYPTFIGLAKSIVAGCAGPEHAVLRGRALQCISLIASAVGKEVAGVDAAEILNIIIRANTAGGAGGDTAAASEAVDADSYDFMMMAVVRIAATLGADFAPYLPYVLSLLLPVAALTVDVESIDADDPEADEDKPGMVATDVTLNNGIRRKLAINPAQLSRKLAALAAIVNLVDDLGVDVPGFFPFTIDCTKAVIGNLQAPFGSLREMAAGGLSVCLRSALADVANPAKGQQALEAILAELFEACRNERQLEVTYVLAEALQEVMGTAYDSLTDADGVGGPAVPVGAGVLAAAAAARAAKAEASGGAEAAAASAAAGAPAAEAGTPHTVAVVTLTQAEEALGVIKGMLLASAKRRAIVVREIAANPDADEEEAERLEAELSPESDLVTHCVDAMGHLIRTHRADVLPAVGRVMGPFLTPYLGDRTRFMEPLRNAALCMCDDLIEHASPEAHALLPTVVPALLENADPAAPGNHEPFTRQAAVYGLGVCAQFGGEPFAPSLPRALQALYAVITAPGARDDGNAGVTENAVSALAKVARFRRGAPGVDEDALMGGVLASLPFRSDGTEARLVHGWLVAALAAGDSLWLGRDGARAPACLSALANALLAHKVGTSSINDREAAAAAAAAAGTAGDDDEDESEEALFDDATLARLPGLFAAIKASPRAAAVAAVVRGMKRKQQAVLAEHGLVLA